MPSFADFAGKKTYVCKKCNKGIQYAKFFGDDGKLITTDGKEPNGKFGKESNVFTTSVFPDKTLHECYPVEWPMKTPPEPKESQLKDMTLLLDIPAQTELDKKVLDRETKDSYQQTFLLVARYKGVRQACLECKIDNPAVIGMFFNQLCNKERHNES